MTVKIYNSFPIRGLKKTDIYIGQEVMSMFFSLKVEPYMLGLCMKGYSITFMRNQKLKRVVGLLDDTAVK